ncbi:hypothetical protein H4O09_05065 [Stenotrophomonas sp. W1S232]|jgi:hypothetical protein|uniref:Uncharacterized protein n=1 Tax=Stenotrophomonas koreensis TaxID=266128 RepID=A0A0R0BLK0_9GAMM|nr:hypothetical protein [Stenotrophomonas koreensis]KRG57947.1 hypothetical protein ABB25_09050 [Stenotrophomonas koreensis]MBB1116435.1 hypothetical protein [Stenotrophomonas koreensis]
MTDFVSPPEQWWLASLGRTLIWARLRVREAGTAEVLDSDGNTLNYDSEDTARAMLFDAEFVAWDGLDQDDALARGFSLDEVAPPQAASDEDLVPLMVRQLGARA